MSAFRPYDSQDGRLLDIFKTLHPISVAILTQKSQIHDEQDLQEVSFGNAHKHRIHGYHLHSPIQPYSPAALAPESRTISPCLIGPNSLTHPSTSSLFRLLITDQGLGNPTLNAPPSWGLLAPEMANFSAL